MCRKLISCCFLVLSTFSVYTSKIYKIYFTRVIVDDSEHVSILQILKSRTVGFKPKAVILLHTPQ